MNDKQPAADKPVTRKHSRPGKRKVRNKKEKAKSLRCFFGLAFPLYEALAPVHKDLQEFSFNNSGLRLAPAADLHVTLKFLGAIQKQQLTEFEMLAASICQKFPTLKLQAQGLGIFRNSIWAGINEDATLSELAASFDMATQRVGIAADSKAYRPHVTVARFKASDRISLSSLLEKYESTDWGRFESKQVHLYLSETLQEGARYSILKSFDLTAT